MSTGGGDNIEVGGISASVELNTSTLAGDLKRAEMALKETGNQIKTLQDYIKSTGGSVAVFEQELNKLANIERQQQAEVRQLKDELKGLDDAVTKTSGSMRSYRMASHGALMVGSDVMTGNVHGLTGHLERLGYGMSAVAGLAPMMGAAIGAGFFLAAAGVKQVVEHWDELRQTFGLESTKTEADHMEDLGKKTHKTADETKRLNDYKREQAQIESMMRLATAEHGAAGKAGQEALAESGVEDVRLALENAMKKEGTFYGDDAKSAALKAKKGELATAQKGMDDPAQFESQFKKLYQEDVARLSTEVSALEAEVGARTTERIEKLMNAVINGTTSQQAAAGAQIAAILGKHSDIAPEGAVERLKEASPEGRGKRLESDLQSEQDEKVLELRKKEEADYIKRDVAGAAREKKREELKERMEAEAARSRDEEMNEATAGWDPRTMKGRKGLRQEAAQRVADAEEEAPGVGKQAESATAALMARGASPEKVAEMVGAQVARALEKAGMTPEEAKAASVDVAKKAEHDVKEKITKKALDDKEAGAKASETFKAEDLQNRLQASVGGEKAKSMSLEDKSIEALAAKFKENGLRWNVV